MIRVLDNGKIMLRNLDTKENEVMSAKKLIEYLESQLEDQIKLQDQEDGRINELRDTISGASQKPSK